MRKFLEFGPEFQAKKTWGCRDQRLSAVNCASSRRRGAIAGGQETWDPPLKFLLAFVLILLLFPPSSFTPHFLHPTPLLKQMQSPPLLWGPEDEQEWSCSTSKPWGQWAEGHSWGSLAGLNCSDLGLGLRLHFRKGQCQQDYHPARQGSQG